MVAGRAILAVPHPGWPSWDAHLLPAAPFSPERKAMGTDGDARRHHLQTWMAQLNPNCIRATRGAGQDLTWESSGKESCPEPGWRRENAKPLRTATLPDGAKWPRRTPDCLHSRRGKGGGTRLAHWWKLGLCCAAPHYRNPGAHARRPSREEEPSPVSPACGALTSVQVPRQRTGRTRLCAPERGPVGKQGALREVFAVTLVSAR